MQQIKIIDWKPAEDPLNENVEEITLQNELVLVDLAFKVTICQLKTKTGGTPKAPDAYKTSS